MILKWPNSKVVPFISNGSINLANHLYLSRNIQLFKNFRAEILTLAIWKIDDFINSFQLYLNFIYVNRTRQ